MTRVNQNNSSKQVVTVNAGKKHKCGYKNFSLILTPNNKSLKFATPVSKHKCEQPLLAENKNTMVEQTRPLLINEDNKVIKQAGKVVASIKQRQIDAYDELENYKRLIKKRRKRLIARIFTFLLLLIVAPVIIFIGTIIIDKDSRHDFFGYNFYIVATESMEPEIMVNDCVVLSKVTDVFSLKVGDDIGYINDKGTVVVHRIETIIETESGSLEFETGGINNLSSDQKRVGFEQIVGKRIATLSTLGNAIVFFRSIPGIIVFFATFAAIMTGFYVAFRLSENIKYIESVD